MLSIQHILLDSSLLYSLCNITNENFIVSSKRFGRIREKREQERSITRIRKRARGGGRKAHLSTDEEKLFFILFYFNIHPTHQVAASLFNVSPAAINIWIKRYKAIAEEALERTLHTPERTISSVDLLIQLYPGITSALPSLDTSRSHD